MRMIRVNRKRELGLIWTIISVVVLLSCKKDPPLWKTKNLNADTITVLGHGGMGIFSLYPMDSYESVHECLSMGADGSEMDLQMSSDSVLFLFHSDELSDGTKCSGKIFEKNSGELNCTYNSVVHPGIEIVTLDGLFQKIGSNTNFFTFECKLNQRQDKDYLNAFANGLIKHIMKYDLIDRCTVESTDPDFLKLLASKKKELHLFLYTVDFDLGLYVAKEQQLYGLTFDMFKITKEQIRKAHENNVRIALFNQQTEDDNLDAIQMDPDFIQTDKLKHILKIFEKYRE
jgi:glycerophosphoryl diester phosphodiesterase